MLLALHVVCIGPAITKSAVWPRLAVLSPELEESVLDHFYAIACDQARTTTRREPCPCHGVTGLQAAKLRIATVSHEPQCLRQCTKFQTRRKANLYPTVSVDGKNSNNPDCRQLEPSKANLNHKVATTMQNPFIQFRLKSRVSDSQTTDTVTCVRHRYGHW